MSAQEIDERLVGFVRLVTNVAWRSRAAIECAEKIRAASTCWFGAVKVNHARKVINCKKGESRLGKSSFTIQDDYVEIVDSGFDIVRAG